MNFRIAAIFLTAFLLLSFPSVLYAADADDEAAWLFEDLRAAGAQMGDWTLSGIKSDAGSIQTNWENAAAAGNLRIILQARNEAAPSYAMTRLYNVFAESGTAGSELGASELELLEALLVYLRNREAASTSLMPFDEFRRMEEKRRAEEVQERKTAAARQEELRIKSLNRLLPAGVAVRDFGDDAVLLLPPLLLFMIWATLFTNRINLLGLEMSLRASLRDFSNRTLKFIVIFQAILATAYLDTEALKNLLASPLLPSSRYYLDFSNFIVSFLPDGGVFRFIVISLFLAFLIFLFFYEVTLLSFLLFPERRQALSAVVFTVSFPWFLLPAKTLLPVLFFGWLFTYSLICAIILSRFIHYEWKLGCIMALAVALACLVHPLGLAAALFIPLMAVLDISNSRVAVGRFSNWISWFAGALACALVLLDFQSSNPGLTCGGVFAVSPAEILENLSRLRWLNLSIGSLPHLIFLLAGFLLLVRGRVAPEIAVLAFILTGGALLCAVMPLWSEHPLLYGGQPGLAGLVAAPAVSLAWSSVEQKPLALRLFILATLVFLSAISPYLGTLTS